MLKGSLMNTPLEVSAFLTSLKEMGIEEVFFDTGIEIRDLVMLVKNCKRCRLFQFRTNAVFGEGRYDADIMFVGEAPGEEEDKEGRPFVGKAGRLLTRLMEEVGLDRKESYICNVLKCRPPNNRDPEKDQIEACKPYLFKQIDFVRPKAIVALGRHAYNTIFGTDERITRVRGEVKEFRGIKVIPTYHPSFLLRNEDKVEEALEDLERAKDFL